MNCQNSSELSWLAGEMFVVDKQHPVTKHQGLTRPTVAYVPSPKVRDPFERFGVVLFDHVDDPAVADHQHAGTPVCSFKAVKGVGDPTQKLVGWFEPWWSPPVLKPSRPCLFDFGFGHSLPFAGVTFFQSGFNNDGPDTKFGGNDRSGFGCPLEV